MSQKKKKKKSSKRKAERYSRDGSAPDLVLPPSKKHILLNTKLGNCPAKSNS